MLEVFLILLRQKKKENTFAYTPLMFDFIFPMSGSVSCDRMHDIELMHMRYSLQSAVLALGEMEKGAGDGNECYHKALSYLRNMQNFMEAIKSTPRKVGSSVTCS